MPELTRTITLSPDLTITLHEPSLTSDNLGHKTWASSFCLAKRLPFLLAPTHSRILELGAGTGLVGLAAGARGWEVTLTDLPEIVGNLERNVQANAGVLIAEVETKVLDWRKDAEGERFGVVVAADPIYDKEHPALLAGVIAKRLEKGGKARAVVEMPLRAGYERERNEFRAQMRQGGLVLRDEGVEVAWDDWGVGGGEVECWWTVWGWDEKASATS